MPEIYSYNPYAGRIYAQSYALHENLPESQKLFYYGDGEDCTNFISQCVWAAYGGWLPGFSENAVQSNEDRILDDMRQVKSIWYGSKSNIGANRWCRVEEFYVYVTDLRKSLGPKAAEIAAGDWGSVDPATVHMGDVIQLVVADYAPNRFGHGLYVTREGDKWDDVLICSHTDDRLDEPIGWFAQFPDVYTKLRVLRFSQASFSK